MAWSGCFTILVVLSCAIQGDGSGSAAHLNNLLKTIFEDQGYNTMVRPSHNYSEALDVKVEIVFNSILKMLSHSEPPRTCQFQLDDLSTAYVRTIGVTGTPRTYPHPTADSGMFVECHKLDGQLDLKQQIMRTTGFFRVQWQDDLLTWDPDKFGGMSEIIVPQNKLWHPDVAFYNTVEEKRYPGSDETLVVVYNTGRVYWAPAFTLDTACKFDVTKYPFDKNTCSIRVFSWMNDNTSVKLTFGESPVSFALVLENGEYKVEAAEPLQDFMLSERTGLFYDELIFQVKLARRPGYFILSLLMPVMLLAIMCSTSFLLAPDEQDKLTVAITVLLSFTVFLGVIDQDMPETSDNISLLVVYVSCMLAVGFICVLGNVIVIKCDRWESGKKGSQPLEGGDVIKNGLAMVSGKENTLLPKSFPTDCTHQSDVLITDSDKMSDQSTTPRDDREDGGLRSRRSGFWKCQKPRWSMVLNRIFFILNLTIVLSLTILMWVMMLS